MVLGPPAPMQALPKQLYPREMSWSWRWVSSFPASQENPQKLRGKAKEMNGNLSVFLVSVMPQILLEHFANGVN